MLALHWKVPSDTVWLVSDKLSLSTCVWRGIDAGHCLRPASGKAMLRTGYTPFSNRLESVDRWAQTPSARCTRPREAARRRGRISRYSGLS